MSETHELAALSEKAEEWRRLKTAKLGTMNVPVKSRDDTEGQRLIGWRVPQEYAGLSEALFALDRIEAQLERASSVAPAGEEPKLKTSDTERAHWREVGTGAVEADCPACLAKELMRQRVRAADDIDTLSAALTAERATREAAEKDKDGAYEERNNLVAALARLYPSGVKTTDIPGWLPEWHSCVYVDLPTGQASWHYHDSQAHLFADLPPYAGEWDGHDTPEKYRRVASLRPAENAGDTELLTDARNALRLLLGTPEIADAASEDKDSETHDAESMARAAIEKIRDRIAARPAENAGEIGTVIKCLLQLREHQRGRGGDMYLIDKAIEAARNAARPAENAGEIEAEDARLSYGAVILRWAQSLGKKGVHWQASTVDLAKLQNDIANLAVALEAARNAARPAEVGEAEDWLRRAIMANLPDVDAAVRIIVSNLEAGHAATLALRHFVTDPELKTDQKQRAETARAVCMSSDTCVYGQSVNDMAEDVETLRASLAALAPRVTPDGGWQSIEVAEINGGVWGWTVTRDNPVPRREELFNKRWSVTHKLAETDGRVRNDIPHLWHPEIIPAPPAPAKTADSEGQADV